MSIDPATALVVRGSDWSETSRIATLWTREFGKVRALAKGGRRLKSTFETALDLLTVCDVMVIRKHSGGLDLLTEARVRERFPQLRADLPALYGGYYIAELLSDGTADGDPHPPLFDAALASLRALAGRSAVPAVLSAFELVWLRELGYSPRLDACAGCGGELGPRVGFSPTAGGALCAGCLPTAHDRRPVSAVALSALRTLAGGDAELPQDAAGEVRRLLGLTVSSVLGRRPKLLAYVDGN